MPDTSAIAEGILLKKEVSLLTHYEPYDGTPADDDHPVPKFAPGGNRFQKSAMMSTKRTRIAIAGTQNGKSMIPAPEVVIMMTHEIPYSLRVDEGVDTKIVRALPSQHQDLGEVNIQRWGRRDKKTGEHIDYCWHDRDLSTGEKIDGFVEEDGTWDCGTIIGVGKYPEEKLCRTPNQQAWIFSWNQAREVRWKPLMDELIPDHCLDRTKGTNGFSEKKQEYYINDGRRIRLGTYEQKFEKAEAANVHVVVLDEEPLSREFYTSSDAHAKWLIISFTSLHGTVWTYDDLYLPAMEGRNPDMELFHATAYDCPFFDQRKLRSMEKSLKPHEIDTKLLGLYSKREGRPYFPYEICKRYLDDFRPRHKTLSRIYPSGEARTVDKTIKMLMKSSIADEPGSDVWEIYEDRQDTYTYFMACDCGQGSDNPEEVQDRSAAYVFRKPDKEKNEDELWPVMVAALYSGDKPETFAWLCLYAACYFNRCLIAPETKGGEGSSFTTEIRQYPHIMHMTVTNDRTRKPKRNLGFDTNARTRTSAINKVRKWINHHDQEAKLYHLQLLKEMLDLIWLKRRPDHPEGGYSDCIIAFAIILWVWEEERGQITNNRPLPQKKDEIIWDILKPHKNDGRKILGRRTLSRGKRSNIPLY